MRIIPGKTKVQLELFRGITLTDMAIGMVGAILVTLVIASSLPLKWLFVMVVACVCAILLARLDEEPNYIYLLNVLKYLGLPRRYDRVESDQDLVDVNERGAETVNMEKAFEDPEIGENFGANHEETKAERKERLAREKAERKADDKILKSKTATKEEKDAIWLKRANQSAANSKAKRAAKESKASWYEMQDIMAFTDIKDGYIEYGGVYYGAVIEIPPVEFRFFSSSRRNNSIENGLGAVLRTVNIDYAANIVKIERPVQYDRYLQNEFDKLEDLRRSYEQCMITEEEFQIRVEVLYERIEDLKTLINDEKVVQPFYYVVLFDSDKNQLSATIDTAMDSLRIGELSPKRLDTKELAVFLKYTNQLDFDEKEIERLLPEQYAEWAMPKTVEICPRTVRVNNIITHNMRLVNYPTIVGDAWIAGVMSIPNTKVVMKCEPMDRGKAIRTLDRSLQELRSKFNSTNVDSQLIELQTHIDTLQELLLTLSNDNESILNVSIYVTGYDIVATRNDPKIKQPPETSYARTNNLKKNIRRIYQEQSFRLNNMEFNQTKAYIGSQVSAYDPMFKEGRGMPSNTIAASFPWIYAHISDENGIKMGSSNNVPVFIDFFRRDSERVNSNMVIVGKSGSGKSYATKSLLTNLAADDAKIFILDPENEYTELAANLHGKFINVGNAQFGRLNPFHIITALDDDESDGSTVSGSYATHLQFLEEFFKQIIPDCEKDAMEYLNSLVDRTYAKKGITPETDLSSLRPEDYPVFDDLYDNILMEFQSTDNEYIRTMLRTLMNYIAKFSTGGRNATIWNGPSSVTTDENFTVFNFQSLLANRNGSIANAQMLLVLKYIDNEIIKNRDYNTKYGLKRKVVVVIDEAHVFIDSKFPVALDFMYQLAKRIRKYNGMQIVITQNIKDFVGSEELSRKSTAIINACQYSFIFALAPNDMGDLCTLYEKAGGINENEQEQIVQAPRGQAFTILGPASRSTFKVKVPDGVVRMFEEQNFESSYFDGYEGDEHWDGFIGESRKTHDANMAAKRAEEVETKKEEKKSHVTLVEMTDEEIAELQAAKAAEKQAVAAAAATINPLAPRKSMDFDLSGLEEFDIPDIPEDPQEFAAMAEEKAAYAVEPAMPEKPAPVVAAEPERAERPIAVAPAAPVTPTAFGAEPVLEAVRTAVGGSSGTTTEILLAELLNRFSYAAMMDEVRRAVKEEMGTAGSQFAAAEAAMPAAAEPEPQIIDSALAEQTESLADDFDIDALFDSLAGSESTAVGRIEPVQIEVPSESAEDTETFDFDSLFDATSEDADGGFDIMKLLEMEAEKLDETSPIEEMITYGETVVEITLEQLARYNKAKVS